MLMLKDFKNPHTPVLPSTPNFYLNEYLQNNLTLKGYEGYDFNVVEDPEVMYYICIHASLMQKYRNWYKKSIHGTSGYRPELYNDVVLPAHGYASSKTSDHKFKRSGAMDTDVPPTQTNINKWKEIVLEAGYNWSVGMYKWGTHLGFRVGKDNRIWDNR